MPTTKKAIVAPICESNSKTDVDDNYFPTFTEPTETDKSALPTDILKEKGNTVPQPGFVESLNGNSSNVPKHLQSIGPMFTEFGDNEEVKNSYSSKLFIPWQNY